MDGSYRRLSRDHNDSVRAVATRDSAASARYGAFGETDADSLLFRRAFAGYEPDAETGLLNAYLRLYCPDARRFVSVDSALQPPSPYLYCEGDPFNSFDPSGEASTSTIVSTVISAAILVASVVATLLTAGAAAPVVVAEVPAEIGAEAGAEAGVEAGVEAGAEAGAEAGIGAGAEGADELKNVAIATPGKLGGRLAQRMPMTAKGFARTGAILGGGQALFSGTVDLAQKAVTGEHISAWNAVWSMLIRPIVAAGTGALGGASAFGTANLFAMFNGIGSWSLCTQGLVAASVSGAVVTSASQGVFDMAAEGTIRENASWKQLGVSMGIAAAEAIVLAPFFVPAQVRPGTAPLPNKSLFYRGGAFTVGRNLPAQARIPIGDSVGAQLRRIGTYFLSFGTLNRMGKPAVEDRISYSSFARWLVRGQLPPERGTVSAPRQMTE
jgi:RHS repeat-associated protein